MTAKRTECFKVLRDKENAGLFKITYTVDLYLQYRLIFNKWCSFINTGFTLIK